MSGIRYRSLLPSRRSFAALVMQGAAWALGGPARGQDAADRGVGGTGAALGDPSETRGQDRGIGGTGVVGTVQGFGSIIVNGMRVTFPPDVSVTIDGRTASIRDVKLGHVVNLLAHERHRVLATGSIAVRSEVVGPVDRISGQRAVVLGQVVQLEAEVASRLRVGQIVAVSGLRRPDAIVVASLVEERPGAALLLRGTLAAVADGTFRIGTLRVAGIEPGLAGHTLSLKGARFGDEFKPSDVAVEPRAQFPDARHLSIESYVVRESREIRLDTGLRLSVRGVDAAELRPGTIARAVVVATRVAGGRLALASLKVERAGPAGAHGSKPRGRSVPSNRSDPSKGHPGAAGIRGSAPGSGHAGSAGGKGNAAGGSRGGAGR